MSTTNLTKRKTKFPQLPPKYSSSRELRNKAEKIRRDRLNGLIDEMKMLVPIICNKWVDFYIVCKHVFSIIRPRNQKSEKTRSNILRLTANYLKVSQSEFQFRRKPVKSNKKRKQIFYLYWVWMTQRFHRIDKVIGSTISIITCDLTFWLLRLSSIKKCPHIRSEDRELWNSSVKLMWVGGRWAVSGQHWDYS